jgi:hypothetical protein
VSQPFEEDTEDNVPVTLTHNSIFKILENIPEEGYSH